MKNKYKYGKHFVVEMIPYNTQVIVSLGEDKETIIKTLYGYKCPKDVSQPIIDQLDESSSGYFLDFSNGFMLLAVKNYPINLKDFKTLVHEITHVSQATLEFAGIKISEETTEPLAYTTAYLYYEIMKKV